MRPGHGEVLHFSHDPTITRFVPRPTDDGEPLVWAVDAPRCPDYWFPRDCPRAMAWTSTRTTPTDAARILGPGGGHRVHAIEHTWLPRLTTARLYAYRLPAAPFTPYGGDEPHAMVARHTVEPLAPAEPVGDLLELHRTAGIQLRLLDNLWPFWDDVTTTTLSFSGIRLRNATPRP